MTYSNAIQVGDIIYASYYSLSGKKYGRYFYVIYLESEDSKINQSGDCICLFITTKKPKTRSIRLIINNKVSYCKVDSEIRLMNIENAIQKKDIKLTPQEKNQILKEYKMFTKEKIKQLKRGKK